MESKEDLTALSTSSSRVGFSFFFFFFFASVCESAATVYVLFNEQ